MQNQKEKDLILISEHGATPEEVLEFAEKKVRSQEVFCVDNLDDAKTLIKDSKNVLLLADLTEWTVQAVGAKIERLEQRFPDEREYIIFQLKEYIHAHLSENLSLANLAALIGISPNYLCTIFHTYSGMTLRTLVEKERMEQAAFLLAHREMTTYEVAFSVGYHHVSYFCKKFHDTYGMTPGEYRAQSGS